MVRARLRKTKGVVVMRKEGTNEQRKGERGRERKGGREERKRERINE